MNDFDLLDRPAADTQIDLDLSVVVPSSNTAAYLPACLNSLSNQRGLRLELIVVDYKSKDGSLDVVRDFARRYPEIPVTIVRQNTPGLGDARNIGLDLAEGEFVAFLDSDDFYTPDSYTAMVHYARAQRCDLIFCRAMVFDDTTRNVYPFYDDWIWEEILGGRDSLTTNVQREPRLLKLEPNASVRIMRRAFMLEREIRYPEKKRAEDLVPHYRSLFEADRVGVVSRRGFFYRVGRAGKLTSDPSKWIGDLLEATARAMSESNHYRPSGEMGGAMLYLTIRSLFGYGTQLPFQARHSYFTNASLLIAQLPYGWVHHALTHPMHPQPLENLRMKMALHALRTRAIYFLVF